MLKTAQNLMQHPPPANKENTKFIVRWSHTIRRFLDLAVLPITMHCTTAMCCDVSIMRVEAAVHCSTDRPGRLLCTNFSCKNIKLSMDELSMGLLKAQERHTQEKKAESLADTIRGEFLRWKNN